MAQSTATPDEDALARVVERIDPGSRLLRAWSLKGGVSAQVSALEVERPDGRTERLIVRQHGEADRRRNPTIARDELTLLRVARSYGLAAPAPIYADDSGDLLPGPFIVLEHLDGEIDVAPADVSGYVRQMAGQLATIHAVMESPELAFLPRCGRGFGPRPAQLDHSLGEERIREALESSWPLPHTSQAVLLHGDFWPGNLLWEDGRLVGVLDWEDAMIGDPLADLGNTRLETLWALGEPAMEEFTRAYASLTGLDLTNLPYWDLRAALRPCSKLSGWGLDEATEARMRARHGAFIAQAIEGLAARRG